MAISSAKQSTVNYHILTLSTLMYGFNEIEVPETKSEILTCRLAIGYLSFVAKNKWEQGKNFSPMQNTVKCNSTGNGHLIEIGCIFHYNT